MTDLFTVIGFIGTVGALIYGAYAIAMWADKVTLRTRLNERDIVDLRQRVTSLEDERE